MIFELNFAGPSNRKIRSGKFPNHHYILKSFLETNDFRWNNFQHLCFVVTSLAVALFSSWACQKIISNSKVDAGEIPLIKRIYPKIDVGSRAHLNNCIHNSVVCWVRKLLHLPDLSPVVTCPVISVQILTGDHIQNKSMRGDVWSMKPKPSEMRRCQCRKFVGWMIPSAHRSQEMTVNKSPVITNKQHVPVIHHP